ncbi:MAG: hypothetical protein H0V01_02795 [Bacteroidetes bacterium]|nr:hypothetical protein [Bacteroidota bacterium]HET6244738.1 hypothetical protein [Bacteroidia bacterium]
MISKIVTIQHLRLEILRRKTLGKKQTELIKNDFQELKHSLGPLNLVQNAFTNKAITTTLLSSTAFFTLSVTARNALLNKTSGIIKDALGYILPKVTSKISSELSHIAFSKLKAIFSKENILQ